MVPHYEHIEMATDYLTRNVFTFCLLDNYGLLNLRLVGYSEQKRKTKRHGWKVERYYDSYRRRDATIKRDEITVPEAVITAAVIHFSSLIKFTPD